MIPKLVTVVSKSLIGAALLSSVGMFAGCEYFYNVAIERNQKDFLSSPRELERERQQLKVNWVERQSLQTWALKSSDELMLVASYLPAKEPTNKTVILAHGYFSKGTDMTEFAEFYHEKMGYNVLMPDSRGHGKSEGTYIGFGWQDRLDYIDWIDQVIEKNGEDSIISLHGVSMGGATVMMVSGEKLPPQVKVIVEDCGYTSVYEELSYQLEKVFNMPDFPMIPLTSLLTEIKAGYNFYEASAIEQVKKSKVPMLFIHGSDDSFVPSEMAKVLYDACQTEKDLLIVENADHASAYTKGNYAYQKKLREFVGMYMSSKL